MWVDVLGDARHCIERADVERLLARFNDEHFFDLRHEYSMGVIDVPETRVTLSIDGRTKQVRHSWTARSEVEWMAREHGIPVDEALVDSLERLDALAQAIDDVGGAAWWRGRIRTSADARREQMSK